MSMTDPIADMLARIRNAGMRSFVHVEIPYSKVKKSILDVLLREGYIESYDVVQSGDFMSLKVFLKYYSQEHVIAEMRRVSKPGRRVYCGVGDLPRVRNGLGISVVSTHQGVLSDAEARDKNLGGEVICTVF